jgi:hypothetical protein
MKKVTVVLATVIAFSIAAPAHACLVPIGGFIEGGSWGQEFSFGSIIKSGKKVVSVRLELQPLLSRSFFEAVNGRGVLKDFNQPYQEKGGSTTIRAEAEKTPGFDGADNFACKIWFDDETHSSRPSEVSFRCEIESEDSFHNRERECVQVNLHDDNHDGKINDGEHWECKTEPPEVPEPGAAMLLGFVLGAGGLLRLRRRSR